MGGCRFGLFQSAERGKGLPDDLIHVVIFVGAETTNENHVVLRARQRLISLVERLVLGSWNGVVWFAVGSGKFVRNAGLGVRLACKVLIFSDPRVAARPRRGS